MILPQAGLGVRWVIRPWVLGSYTGWLGTTVAGLPGITGGLRNDDVDAPIPPETVRNHAPPKIRATADSLTHVETAISAAHQRGEPSAAA